MVCLFLFFIFNVCSGLSDPLVRFMVSRNDSCVPSMRRKTDAVWNLISSEMARFKRVHHVHELDFRLAVPLQPLSRARWCQRRV